MPFSVLNPRVLCVRPIGIASDFCPVCRQERRFHLAQADRKRYFLCFDQGREGQPHHELTCFVCGCKVERPAAERPIEILPDPTSAGSYEPAALPVVGMRIADCVAMEEALQGGGLKGDDREEMIRYTMFSFARIYDEDPFERIKPWVRLTMTNAGLAIAGLGWYASDRSGTLLPILVALVAILLMFISVVYWVTRHSPRKRVRTWLARALVPIDPTLEELERARKEMQSSRIAAGDQICCEKVMAKVKKMRGA